MAKSRRTRRQTGISRAVAEALPQDKESEVRRLCEEGQIVAIGAGSDIAIESAAMSLSPVRVVTNARRLRWFK